MNACAAAYLAAHGKWADRDGVAEWMLPLEQMQAFLDLLQPSDVRPEKLQKLYHWQGNSGPGDSTPAYDE